MITIQEWNSMSGKEQTLWLMQNEPANKLSLSMRNLVECVGVNDSSYCTKPMIDGKRATCPCYVAWGNMLSRAYNAKYRAKRPTYSGVKVCDDWHSFVAFRKWWIDNQVDGWELDKDILSDSGVYSQETSIFIPAWLNLFTTDSGASRGAYPIGVYFHKGKGRFRALCGNPITKKRELLGYFATPEAAHLAWRARKLELALELKPRMDEIDQRIYPRVVEIINNAK